MNNRAHMNKGRLCLLAKAHSLKTLKERRQRKCVCGLLLDLWQTVLRAGLPRSLPLSDKSFICWEL